MINSVTSWLWPADRLGCRPAIRATSHHVGRVAVISADGHARRSHHRMKCAVQSVGHEWFDALGNAYMARKAGLMLTLQDEYVHIHGKVRHVKLPDLRRSPVPVELSGISG